MFLVISVNLYLTRGHYISVINGQNRFFRLCPYLHYTGVLGRVNKACLKQAVFTGCVRSDVLQNRFPAGNGSAPVLPVACPFFAIFLVARYSIFKRLLSDGKPSCFLLPSGVDDRIPQWYWWCKLDVLRLLDT